MEIEFRNQALELRERVDLMLKSKGIYNELMLLEARVNLSYAVSALNVSSDYKRAIGCFAKACALVGVVLGKAFDS